MLESYVLDPQLKVSPEDQYYNAYSVMLKGRASNFYYDKIAGRAYNFQTMVTLTKTHFETEENHQKNLPACHSIVTYEKTHDTSNAFITKQHFHKWRSK